MTPRGWTTLALAVGVVAGVLTGAVAYSAATQAAWAAGLSSGLTAALVAATFVAILWYSYETRNLLDVHRQSSELDRHPWLSATALRIDHPASIPDGYLHGGQNVWLPIVNEGKTPAFAVSFALHLEILGAENSGLMGQADKTGKDQVVVPKDNLTVRFPPLWFATNERRALARVTIQYATFDGGRGEIALEFRCRDGDWTNGPTRYRFWRADGTECGG
jgi:hypothetical protein